MTVIRTQPPVVTRHEYKSLSTDRFPGMSGDGHKNIPIGSILEYTDNGHTFTYDGSEWWPTGITLLKAIEGLTVAVEVLTDRLENPV